MGRWTTLLVLSVVVASCSESPQAIDKTRPATEPVLPAEATEGFVEVPGGRVWYRVVGDGPGVPLLVLHGGPGAGSRFYEPLEALADERAVVFYDQLGAGRSEKPSDLALWTIERHIAELEAVREALDLSEAHILGHSWGAMLLIEYLLTEPPGVRSATFASPLFSTARWLADTNKRLRELPPDVQAVVEVHEAAGTTDHPEYQEAVMTFNRRFLLRSDPWPPVATQGMEEFGTEVYAYMWGPSEFSATGTLRDWDRMDALPALRLPTLFTVGEYDETFPATVEDYAGRVPDSRFEVLAGASHMTFLDAPAESVRIQREFLRSAAGR